MSRTRPSPEMSSSSRVPGTRIARRSFPERSTRQRAGFSPALLAVNQISRPFEAQHGAPALSVQPADRSPLRFAEPVDHADRIRAATRLPKGDHAAIGRKARRGRSPPRASTFPMGDSSRNLSSPTCITTRLLPSGDQSAPPYGNVIQDLPRGSSRHGNRRENAETDRSQILKNRELPGAGDRQDVPGKGEEVRLGALQPSHVEACVRAVDDRLAVGREARGSDRTLAEGQTLEGWGGSGPVRETVRDSPSDRESRHEHADGGSEPEPRWRRLPGAGDSCSAPLEASARSRTLIEVPREILCRVVPILTILRKAALQDPLHRRRQIRPEPRRRLGLLRG